MRAGGCTVQQALTNEAANVVKQAVTLARRRGHAQVTPLHVANTMLSASTGLLRTACIQSHAHPLQCRALELCFNVALNRLPASASSPMLGTYWQYPSISNALVAAFKRAQAHQRRGSIENPQQPLLAVKIELEQLIISILDDPNVSRVMREAGFTSTQVKSNVEQAVSLEICSQNSPSVDSNKSRESSNADLALSQPHTASQVASNKTGKPRGSDPIIRDEDVMFVMENLMNEKRRSFVVVGECISSIEVEVEQKLEELKKHVGNCLGKGIVLNLGDLKWAIEYRASSSEQSRGYYCPVEHMIMEIGKLLVSNIGESGRFKLMGSATFQTYMRCKNGHPSLQTVWGLHPLTIPAGSLRFSLITDSELQSRATSNKVGNGSSWSTWAEPQHHDCPVVEPTQTVEPTSALRLYIAEHNYKDPRPHPSSSPNSACSSDVMEMEYVHKFKELNADNLTTLCTALENKVPWQKDIVPEIVTTILKCRSGMIRRKWKLVDGESTKEETWFFFQGVDVQAKEKIGKELARLVFGSQNNFVSIELSSFSSTKADSTEDCRSKRSRDEQSCSYIERFAEAVSCNPHRVFFIEDVEQSDYFSQMAAKASARDQEHAPPAKLKSDGTFEEDKVGGSEETTSPCVSLDLNMSLDHDSLEEQSIQDIGLLQSVDRRIVFKTQEL
ncbi:putative syntaxin-24-like [Hibiscus syriacus]|uniref:Syntaxin-24-like n=1 Tax=Hibiscus syriacus TaxID=106335 RepID=A0A6A2YMY9_HIBSY|nr:putative syntaxin-24-like [Hibiscus syriacus]